MTADPGAGSLYPENGETAGGVPDFVPPNWTARHSAWAQKIIKHSVSCQVGPIDPSAVSWRQAVVAVIAGPVLVIVLLLFVSMVFAASTTLGVAALVGCAAPYVWVAWSQRPS